MAPVSAATPRTVARATEAATPNWYVVTSWANPATLVPFTLSALSVASVDCACAGAASSGESASNANNSPAAGRGALAVPLPNGGRACKHGPQGGYVKILCADNPMGVHIG